MATFAMAYAPTKRTEGGWANHPADRGGETIYGISRKAWPAWPGWSILDRCPRSSSGAPILGERQPELLALAETFYRHVFWDALRGDQLPSQAIANELFDTAVNMGPAVPGRFLQEVLNAMNDRGRRWPDIPEHGRIGRATLSALEAALARGYEALIVRALNHLQGAKYHAIVRRDPTQEAFYIGWLGRT